MRDAKRKLSGFEHIDKRFRRLSVSAQKFYLRQNGGDSSGGILLHRFEKMRVTLFRIVEPGDYLIKRRGVVIRKKQLETTESGAGGYNQAAPAAPAQAPAYQSAATNDFEEITDDEDLPF